MPSGGDRYMGRPKAGQSLCSWRCGSPRVAPGFEPHVLAGDTSRWGSVKAGLLHDAKELLLTDLSIPITISFINHFLHKSKKPGQPKPEIQ